MQFDRFVDDVYEAAIIPERWSGALDQLAQIADAEGTLLFAAAPGEPRWISSEQIRVRCRPGSMVRSTPIIRAAGIWCRCAKRASLTDLDAFTPGRDGLRAVLNRISAQIRASAGASARRSIRRQ
jgi:hypothetical protein